MAKNKEEFQENKPANLKFGRFFIYVFMLIGIGAGVFFVVENPHLIEKFIPSTTNNQKEEHAVFQQMIGQMQQQIFALHQKMPKIDMEKISSLDSKFEALEKNNLNIIDSKADVASLMGAITRIDKLEAELEKALKVTDEGALILTAAMLVKDSADNGGSFEYEAEILQQITADSPSLKEPVAEIISMAKEGINSKQFLQYEFLNVYNSLKNKQKAQEEKDLNWKQRLNAKINELVKVKKTNEQEEANETELEIIKRLVDAGELSKAISELQLSANSTLLENPELEKWYKQSLERIKFDRAISRIAASSLALMKVNFIKKPQ